MHWHVLWVVEIAFRFASSVIGRLVVEVIHLFRTHGNHVVVLVIAAVKTVLHSVAALVNQFCVFSKL